MIVAGGKHSIYVFCHLDRNPRIYSQLLFFFSHSPHDLSVILGISMFKLYTKSYHCHNRICYHPDLCAPLSSLTWFIAIDSSLTFPFLLFIKVILLKRNSWHFSCHLLSEVFRGNFVKKKKNKPQQNFHNSLSLVLT